MKTLLIIYPHWPPSNLAGVHRPRLISNYLPEFGWHPIVLTVDPKYYEEKPDWDLCKTISPNTEVYHVKAFSITKPRIIGDIGLRAFWQIYQGAKKIIEKRKIDFVWIPIPSFYIALMGRMLYQKFKIPYGIDYIDPWVRDISGRRDWRHIISNWLAKLLEPMAVKKATLVTGVSEEYYKQALLHNFREENIIPPLTLSEGFLSDCDGGGATSSHRHIDTSTHPPIHHFAFPYGFDPNDHKIKPDTVVYPWKEIPNCKPLVYAGAFLPNSRFFVQMLFRGISELIKENKWDETIHLFFLGTGSYQGKTIMDYGRENGIENSIHEDRERHSYLCILNYLSNSFGTMVIGSTEKHYTPSKVFQAVLSERPVLAILHESSSAFWTLSRINAHQFSVVWNEGMNEKEFIQKIKKSLNRICTQDIRWYPKYSELERDFSVRRNTLEFTKVLNTILT